MSLRHLTDTELQSVAEGKLGSDLGRLQEHLNECVECSRVVAQYSLLYTELTDDSGFELSADFAAAVTAQITVGETEKAWSPMVYAGLTAAAVAVLVGVTGYYAGWTWLFQLASTISIPNFLMADSLVSSIKSFFERLNGGFTLILGSGAVLLFFALVDKLVVKHRYGNA